VFPYTNSRGNIIETEKNHSIKHAPNDIVKWGDSINMSCEAPETGHKEWVKSVKKQGARTNQAFIKVQLSLSPWHSTQFERKLVCCCVKPLKVHS